MQTDYDLAIVGGGMVGAMLAAGLAHTQLSVLVVENRQPAPFDPASLPDLRVSAFSLAAERMFRAVGAWQRIADMRVCAYRRLSVEDGENGGTTEFFSGDLGETHLGHIIENRVVQLGLLAVLQDSDNITVMFDEQLSRFNIQPDHVSIELAGGSVVSAQLLVGADGARSAVRRGAHIDVDSSLYPQRALVASIDTGQPQQSQTWQRFLPTGPQAFLPLADGYASLVWYHDEQEIERLQALDDQAFLSELQAAFPARLGAVEQLLGRGSFPLARTHASRYVKPRLALVGDAAHTVHPLAGQGVNLGLLDAAVLAQTLTQARARQRDLGDELVLRHYERWRRGENGLMIRILDAFYQGFGPQPGPLREIRSFALNLANRAGPLKRLVAGYACGNLGDLPLLAHGRLP